jgi:hypothetical protein
MSIPIDASFDPNSQFSGGQLALITRARQELQNKSSVAAIGATLDSLHRMTLDIESQVQRMSVQNEDGFARAGVLLQAIKTTIATSEDERKLVTAPILAVKSSVDQAFSDSHKTLLVTLKWKVEEKMRAYRKRAAALDEVAPARVVESHGVQTQVRTHKHIVVDNLKILIGYLYHHATEDEIYAIVELKQRPLTTFLTRAEGGELKVGGTPAGYTVTELEGFANV